MKKFLKSVAISFAMLAAAACVEEAQEAPLSITRELTFTAAQLKDYRTRSVKHRFVPMPLDRMVPEIEETIRQHFLRRWLQKAAERFVLGKLDEFSVAHVLDGFVRFRVAPAQQEGFHIHAFLAGQLYVGQGQGTVGRGDGQVRLAIRQDCSRSRFFGLETLR